MRRRLLALTAAAAMAVGGGLVGAPGAEAHHCGPVFIFSGHKVGPVRGGGLNPATVCTLRDENLDTNYLVPGANYALVGTNVTPTAGHVVIDDGAPVPLTFTWTGTRWNSQDVDITGGSVVTAHVTSVTGVTVTVTYRAVTEEVPS